LRTHYSQTLEEIRHEVIRMGAKVNDLVKLAVDAAIQGDLELAQRVIHEDDQIDQLEHELHQRTVVTVMKEAPVGTDFRFLVSAMGVIGELEKAADDAVKLARRVRKLSGQFPTELKVSLMELSDESRRMFNASVRLFADYTSELAREIVASDKEVDTKYSQARARVIEMIRENPENTENLVRTIDSFHALEHIADHAVEIARRMTMLYESRPS